MAHYYYSCVPALAWILGRYFYNGNHFVWLSEQYFPYRLPNPKSSNPHLIYQDLYQPWKDKDVHDKFVLQLRLNLRKGVLAQETAGTINSPDAARLKDICDKVDIVFFYPILYRVDIDPISNSRLIVAGSGAAVKSSEFLITNLKQPELEVIFLDFDGDPDFKQLVNDPLNKGISSMTLMNAMHILEGRL